MRQESGATVSDFGTSRPPDDGGAHDVRVEVSRNRDAEFTAFVRDSGAYLHRTAYLLCGDSHRAEELVQSTFERVYRTWAKVRPGTQLAYARRILVNLRIDGWRHGRRESFPGDDQLPVGAAPDHVGRLALRDELVRGLAQLPDRQRRVVVLRHLLDLPEADVARELGIAVGTVKAANSRGLARLRDVLRAGAEAIEPPELDESVVLDRSRAALRRRRTGQAVGAACAALLLALGVLTRGPVELPWVGPVVLPGGQLITSLFDDGPTDGPGPDLGAGYTPVECPDELPGPTPTRAAEPGDDVGPLDDPVMVAAADARSLTCHDVDVAAVTGGILDGVGLPVTANGEPLPEPHGIAHTGKIWHFSYAELLDDDEETDAAHIQMRTWAGDASSSASSLTHYQGRRAFPTGLAVTGDRVVWSERAAEGTSPRRSFLRTESVSGEGVTTLIDPLVSTEERLWLLATTEDRALWTAGATKDDTRLFAITHDGDGTPTELAAGVTALAADDDEAVAAVLVPGTGPVRVTTIRLFDDLAGGDSVGTDLLEIDHDASAEVTQLAVSDDVIAWTVERSGGGPGALYVLDRDGDDDSLVQLPDGVVSDLRASGGLVWWTSTDTAAQNPADASYLYRATASASGYDGPDLARFPGGSVTAAVAGDRTAWLEEAGARRWLVEGAIVRDLERG
ncbi:SigE family RNA polymerase sigma factor [Promicromonospora sp. NPDC060271]|uniref:SigE family RNA polymerase sigma factor n=1 Tax=Promicromonospora sp. NPDC060271 TaxID=3347089 RepID=UPI0036678B84